MANWWEWFWRGRALRDASAAAGQALDPAFVAQVTEHVELADRLTERTESSSNGGGAASAWVLYRTALQLVIDEFRPESESSTAARLELRSGLEPLLTDAEATSLLAADPAGLVKLPEGERRTQAAKARALLHRALDLLDSRHRARGALLLQRAVRTGLLALVVGGVLVAAVLGVVRLTRPNNLLDGAKWHASSHYRGMSAENGTCDGARVRIFFHTDLETDPYIQYDLPAPKEFRHFQLVNRSDCCDDRAFPLAVQVSDDGVKFREVARQTTPFTKIRLDVAPVTAKHVRIQALRKTWLHLEKITAW